MTAADNGTRRSAEAAIRAAIAVMTRVLEQGTGPLLAAAAAMSEAIDRGGQVLVFGNGGSAAEAQHFAAELVGRFVRERRALPALALTTDTSILTALGNDYGFDRVFARQVQALGRPGDVALGLSTSGDSPNVLEALQVARAQQLTTIGMTGRNGGAMAGLVDVHVNVPETSTARIQEVHLLLLHVLCDLIEQRVS